jgi:hypothetical protein
MTNAIDPIASIVRRKLSSDSKPDIFFATPSSIEPPLTPGESFSGRIFSLKLVSHETGIVSSTAAPSTPLRVSGQGMTTARDMHQDGARTTVPTLSAFHIASHSATSSASSTSASASASSYIQRPHRQPMCKFLPRHPHTFISVARLLLLLLLLPLLLQRRIIIGSVPSCAMDIQKFRTLSFRRVSRPQRCQISLNFFVSWVRNCSGGIYISYSVVPKNKEDFDSCCVCFLFSGLAKTKVSSFFLCILTRVSQAPGLRLQLCRWNW